MRSHEPISCFWLRDMPVVFMAHAQVPEINSNLPLARQTHPYATSQPAYAACAWARKHRWPACAHPPALCPRCLPNKPRPNTPTPAQTCPRWLHQPCTAVEARTIGQLALPCDCMPQQMAGRRSPSTTRAPVIPYACILARPRQTTNDCHFLAATDTATKLSHALQPLCPSPPTRPTSPHPT